MMICDIIVQSMDKPFVAMSDEVYGAMMSLREFMFERVYIGSIAKKEEQKAQNMVAELYHYFIRHPQKLPGEQQALLEEMDLHRIVCDYIAGMSDRYAIHKFYEIFIPASWRRG